MSSTCIEQSRLKTIWRSLRPMHNAAGVLRFRADRAILAKFGLTTLFEGVVARALKTGMQDRQVLISIGKRRVTMRRINCTARAAMAGLMLVLMLSLGLVSPGAARPQDRDYGGRWDRTRLTRYAFALGYNRGYEDASQNTYRTYRDVQRWREGSEGWQDPMGNRTIFRDSFRRGFVQGFIDARHARARRYAQGDIDRWTSGFNEGRPVPGPGFDRPGFDRDAIRIADQTGYRDGQRRGLFDAEHGRRIDFDNMSQFRTGLNGYRTQYGGRESYRQAYRDAFRRGYEDAFHGR
jgi:hypothetical protein